MFNDITRSLKRQIESSIGAAAALLQRRVNPGSNSTPPSHSIDLSLGSCRNSRTLAVASPKTELIDGKRNASAKR
jgi:hypothetical protein